MTYKSSIPIILIAIFPYFSIYSQTVLENFGGVRTDFEITSQTKSIPTVAQAIVKRGIYNFDDYDSYGYGTEILILEVIIDTRNSIEIGKELEGKNKFIEH